MSPRACRVVVWVLAGGSQAAPGWAGSGVLDRGEPADDTADDTGDDTGDDTAADAQVATASPQPMGMAHP